MSAGEVVAGRRDLAVLVASRAVTQFGSMLTLVVVALQLQPRGAPAVAAAMAAELVPAVVLAPVAGHVLDRVPNRPLLLGAHLVQASGALALSALLDRTVAVVLLLLLVGSAAAVAGPAQAALVPVVAGDGGTARAFAHLSNAGTLGFLAGLGTAGVLVQFVGAASALRIDAVTYLVEALGVALLRARRTPARVDAAERPGRLDGVRVLVADPLLRVVVAGLAVSLLASTVVNVASVFLVVGELHAPAALYGVVEACWGVGALAGAWLGGRARSDRQHARAVLGGGVVMGGALAAAGALVSVVATIPAWLAGGAANSLQNVGAQSLIGSRVDGRLHGSAFGAFVAVLQACNVASLVLGALLVAHLGAAGTLVAAGAVSGLMSVAALGVVTRRGERDA